MLGVLASALLIIAASLMIGRAALLGLAWRSPGWLAAPVGLAVLVTLAPFLVRLPGRGLTAAILLALLAIASAAFTIRRRAARAGEADSEGRVTTEAPRGAGVGIGHPVTSAGMDAEDGAMQDAERHRGRTPVAVPTRREPITVAVIVTAASLALASLPFLFNERTGVLGEGIYTNDHAAQLYWTDWLATGFGPEPTAVGFGYPVGPQALVASVSEGTGIDLVAAFNGLLIAIPALTALVALALLASLPPARRAVAAVLAGLPYLGASFLAQSGFKETIMALLVVGLAATLHLANRRLCDATAPPAWGVVGALAIMAAAAVFTFSVPGGVWFALAIPGWAFLWLVFESRSISAARLRDAVSEHRRILVLSAAGLLVLAAIALGPASGFIEKIDDVQASSGRLSSPVFPGEALGIWPEGDFRIVRGEVDGALLATGFAALCALGAALALCRRREWALLAALGGAAFVYAAARPFAQIHVEAKALAIMAPLVMLITLRWLLWPRDGSRAATARLAAGALFAALAFASTLLALRAAPVGFDERQRGLEALAERVGPDDKLAFLGVDRFAGYYLRGTLARSPAGYVPAKMPARTAKTWQQGQAVDFDTLEPVALNRQDYVITTAAAYQSTPHPAWREVAREGDYVLWQRTGRGGAYEVLPEEGGDPGVVLVCTSGAPTHGEPGATATILEHPIVGEQERWAPGFHFTVPGSASQSFDLPAGDWSVSLQYHSQAPLSVSVDGETVAELPASLEGFYLVGAGRGAFWPAGEIATGEDPVEVTVTAAEPSGLQRALGVERQIWLGGVALSSQRPAREAALGASCGEYVDRYLPPSDAA